MESWGAERLDATRHIITDYNVISLGKDCGPRPAYKLRALDGQPVSARRRSPAVPVPPARGGTAGSGVARHNRGCARPAAAGGAARSCSIQNRTIARAFASPNGPSAGPRPPWTGRGATRTGPAPRENVKRGSLRLRSAVTETLSLSLKSGYRGRMPPPAHPGGAPAMPHASTLCGRGPGSNPDPTPRALRAPTPRDRTPSAPPLGYAPIVGPSRPDTPATTHDRRRPIPHRPRTTHHASARPRRTKSHQTPLTTPMRHGTLLFVQLYRVLLIVRCLTLPTPRLSWQGLAGSLRENQIWADLGRVWSPPTSGY